MGLGVLDTMTEQVPGEFCVSGIFLHMDLAYVLHF